MTHHNPDLDSTSDWLNQISHAARPIRNTTQIWVLMRHQYGISALVSQTSLGGEPVTASQNVGCFLRLNISLTFEKRTHHDEWERKTQRFFHGTTPDHLKVNHARVLSRIYCLGEKYQVAKATNFLAGSGGMPPGKFFKWICPVMQSSAFWDTILRNGMVVFYFIFLVPCHIVSLDRECLLHVHWPRHIWMIFPI